MIYTVECSFADPASEAEWNDFYSRVKLPALISVSGFVTSQRFSALDGTGPRYLALHTIDAPDVLGSAEYRDNGGGNFARWQPHITDWRRNVYDHAGAAPAVTAHALLAVCDADPAPLARLGLTPSSLHAIALDRRPARRWLAVLARDTAHRAADASGAIRLYAPMGPQLVRTPAAPATPAAR
ncbi:sugar ABC transporter [Burkholderia sp. MR1-5-21]